MIRINESKTRPFLNGAKEKDDTPSSILLFNDSPPTDTDPPVNLPSLEVPLGKLVVDPEITTNNDEGVRIENERYYTDDVVMLNDENFKDFYGVFTSLSIQEFSERKAVISKIHQNFSGDWNVFFFGKSPSIYEFSGVVLDYRDYSYYQEFSMAFDKYISGRSSTMNRFKTKIIYDGKIITGFLLAFSVSGSSPSENIKRFNLQVLVYKEDWLRINTHKISPQRQVTGFNTLMNKGRFVSPPIEGIDYVNDEDRKNISDNLEWR